jgi:hypothetical protein
MNFEVGDVVANQFGHIMAVGNFLPGGKVVCYYECNPGMFHTYLESEIRLISRSRRVEMGTGGISEFGKSIARMQEWVKQVKGLPRKYKGMDGPSLETKEPKVSKEESELIKKFLALSPEEQKEKLRKLKIG